MLTLDEGDLLDWKSLLVISYISGEYFNTIFDNKLRFSHWWQRKTMEEQQEFRLEVQRLIRWSKKRSLSSLSVHTKELRVGVSQSDLKTLDPAVNVALSLESIHVAENQNNAKINIAEMVGSHGNERGTAGLNTAGTKAEDKPIPVWPKTYFDQ